MKTARKAAAAAAALALLLTLNACGTAASGDSANPSPTEIGLRDISEGVQPDAKAVSLLPQKYKDRGELTVAADPNSPPTIFRAQDGDTLIGLNPDITRLIAKKLGVKIKYVEAKFDTMIPGLDGGRYDFTVSTMAKTDERLKVVDMIDYFKAGTSIGVNAGNPQNLSNETLCGKNVAVIQGSTGQLKRLPALNEKTCTSQGKPAINAVTLPSVQEALVQLHAKRVDGVLYDTTALAWAQTQQPGSFKMLTPALNVGGTGICAVAVKKGSDLTPALQAAVQSILGTPEYKESLKTWGLEFGAIADAKLN
ncbi:ABC transporter substrate-binding protein [Arthrobacter cupressi]|uniref:Polar amino acid transport system substrate-binding protein n=1 Tax=Arthrobacter cupressi TaxID=1045773 RepID=A0A1G8YE38_9MICC|nr:ABC transporter substrate-binding protein [Arthrobacter cupressi]NYD79652.1 polar amino acid transport system substrate-binding protein [Arthrobacter cupressi]SDK00996.1 polar amino acid transport system substrate-binding protein [Arthrobacter cupressi]